MTTGKLADKLTDKVRVKFTDYAINKFQGTEELFNKTRSQTRPNLTLELKIDLACIKS